MVKIKPRYGKVANYNGLLWYCRNFNITTASVDRGKCIKRHLEKLKKYGFIKSVNPYTEYDKVAMDFCRKPFKEGK